MKGESDDIKHLTASFKDTTMSGQQWPQRLPGDKDLRVTTHHVYHPLGKCDRNELKGVVLSGPIHYLRMC